jgi:hypothetical protein
MKEFQELLPKMIFRTRARTLEGFSVRLLGDDMDNPDMGMTNILIFIGGELEISLSIKWRPTPKEKPHADI